MDSRGFAYLGDSDHMMPLQENQIAAVVWLGSRSKGRPVRVELPWAQAVHVVLRNAEGQLTAGEVEAGRYVSTVNRELIRLATGSFPFEFRIAGAKDKDGRPCNMVLSGSFKIAAPLAFVTSISTLLQPGSSITANSIAEVASAHVECSARDALENHTIQELLDDRCLPMKWWRRRLNEWLREFGLTWEITQNPTWSSCKITKAPQPSPGQARKVAGINAVPPNKEDAKTTPAALRPTERAYGSRPGASQSAVGDYGRCSVCDKQIITRLDVAGTCAQDGCEAVICNCCWTTGRNRCCRAHSGGYR